MKRDNIIFNIIIVIAWVFYLLPPNKRPIENTINYKLSGKIEEVIGTIHSTWVHGYFIRLYNIDKSIQIDDYLKKRDSIFKNGVGNENYTYFSNIVKENDSVFKEKGSDILFLYRDNKLIYKCRLKQ